MKREEYLVCLIENSVQRIVKEIRIVVTCYASGIMYIVLLISQKDYVLYKVRINIVFARYTVLCIAYRE